MPEKIEDLGKWIKTDDTNVMEELFIRELPGHNGEWIMLQGRLNQKISDKYAIYYLSGHVELANDKMADEAISKLEVVDAIDMVHMYAEEIGWRLFESRDDDYWDKD